MMRGYKIEGYYDKAAAEWKPCMVFLEIPDGAIVVTPYKLYTTEYSKKLRCNRARVLNIVDLEDGHTINEAISIYVLGKFFSTSVGICWPRIAPFAFARAIPVGTYSIIDNVVKPTALDQDVTEECARGIHFFLTEEDAKNFYETPGADGGRSWVMYVLFKANAYTRKSRLRPTESRRF